MSPDMAAEALALAWDPDADRYDPRLYRPECPDCGSTNLELDDPAPAEHTCRDCGGWITEGDGR